MNKLGCFSIFLYIYDHKMWPNKRLRAAKALAKWLKNH